MDSTEFPTNPFFGRRVRACGARPRPRTRLRRLRAAARSSPASPAGSPLERAHRADARQTTRQTTITTPLTRYLLAQRERRSGSQTTGCFLSNEEARNCSPSFHTQVPEREREREKKKKSFLGLSRANLAARAKYCRAQSQSSLGSRPRLLPRCGTGGTGGTASAERSALAARR